MLCPRPGGLRVYALDTEFSAVAGRLNVTEVAVVDVKTGQVVVNAVFDDNRALIASTKLKIQSQSRSRKDKSAERHAPQVHTVDEMAQQIKECEFQPNDIFIEYSIMTNTLLDLKNVHWLLKRHGYNGKNLIPSCNNYAVLTPIRNFCIQALPFDCWRLLFLFQASFHRILWLIRIIPR